MITEIKFETYFLQSQKLAARMASDEIARQELLQLIEQEEGLACENLPYEDFFEGEHNFYNGKYKNALKHYLQAKSIPYFKLFCYRASAYVSREREEYVQAMNFAKEALQEYPNDFPTLVILADLLDRDEQHEEAQEVRNQIYALEGQALQTTESQHVPCHGKEECAQEKAIDAQSLPLAGEQEMSMNCQDHIIENKQPVSAETLTHHLPDENSNFVEKLNTDVHLSPSPQLQMEIGNDTTSAQSSLLQELKKLASTMRMQDAVEKMADVNLQAVSEQSNQSTGGSLESTISSFQNKQSVLLSQYIANNQKRPKLTNGLFVLHGWDSTLLSNMPLTEKSRKTSGGYFIHWNGKGVAVNPGQNFMKNFHQAGLFVKDIDYVIVTGSAAESYADIAEIYELNYQLNKINPELHIINYHLCQKAHQNLSPILKPNFKQERNTVHCLELFLDSPDVEKTVLSNDMTLTYFPGSSTEVFSEDRLAKAPSCLGIRLDLKNGEEDRKAIRLGYISGTGWSPLLSHHLGHCDVLITGFGSTGTQDYNRLKYNDDSLGYNGTLSLTEEVHPSLLLCSEFSGKDGDIRLEVIKKMRKDLAASEQGMKHSVSILPADSNLFVNLKGIQVRCNVSNAVVEPSSVVVMKTAESFGTLQYLSGSCCG